MSDPYSYPPHLEWVESAKCPSINRHKAWCNGDMNHPDPHWAPYLYSDGKVERRSLRTTWTKMWEYPRD